MSSAFGSHTPHLTVLLSIPSASLHLALLLPPSFCPWIHLNLRLLLSWLVLTWLLALDWTWARVVLCDSSPLWVPTSTHSRPLYSSRFNLPGLLALAFSPSPAWAALRPGADLEVPFVPSSA